MIDAALILAEGRVPEFLSSNPQFCPELLALIRDLEADLRNRISSGDTKGAWGEDYKADFLTVVESLKKQFQDRQ